MVSNFNKVPSISIKGMDECCSKGWEMILPRLNESIVSKGKQKNIIVVECYQGIKDEEVLGSLIEGLAPVLIIQAAENMFPEEVIRAKTQADVTDDRIFGFITRLTMKDFLDPDLVRQTREKIETIQQGNVLIYGPGASLLCEHPELFIYADMARWEIQLRMRRREVNNLGISNRSENFETQYKRGYFVDWRVCDRQKKQSKARWDYVLDTNQPGNPVMITAKAFFEGMKQASGQPFSPVPFFDPGPWGGQWMKETFGLDPGKSNYAWCFNCVPEENSLLLSFGDILFETPAINLVFFQPVQLLGDPVHARFGDEFPIRFDFLDTMQGGNLSLQVHPLTEYIQGEFGINYTQDESYYILEAGEGAEVYLGLKEGIHPAEMERALKEAEDGGRSFDDKAFVQSWPARKHDHFLIPGGTVHCSGKDCMVLEISATPYIFTFKLWDWNRLGMDGKPRPINIERGMKNIQWNRTTGWVRENLVNQVEELASGEGWREERTGLHKREFIETRRHWFTTKVLHNTHDGVNVLALVEGREVLVESPDGKFDPFIVHYAETFVVPARVGEYTITPHGESAGHECATIKAFVRVNA